MRTEDLDQTAVRPLDCADSKAMLRSWHVLCSHTAVISFVPGGMGCNSTIEFRSTAHLKGASALAENEDGANPSYFGLIANLKSTTCLFFGQKDDRA